MSSIDIDIDATDNASEAISSVMGSVDQLSDSAGNAGTSMSSSMDTMSTSVSSSTGEMDDSMDGSISNADLLSDSYGDVSDGAEGAGNSIGDYTNNLTASTGIGMTALTSMDRLEQGAERVENAQERQTEAQERLNEAISKYGANSQQAIDAQQALEIATRNTEIAQQRQEMRMVEVALSVVPQMMASLTRLGTQLGLLTDETAISTEANEAWTASDIAMIGVSTLGVALPIAMMALEASQMASINSTPATNVYGDVNVGGPSASTAAFGSTIQANANMSSRP